MTLKLIKRRHFSYKSVFISIVELNHYGTYVLVLTKCSYIQLDIESTLISVNVKDERNGIDTMHDGDSNAPE